MTTRGLAIVAGAGEGLGQALLSRFEHEGLKAVGLSRSVNNVSAYDSRVCDLSNPIDLDKVLGALVEDYGVPRVVVHNPAQLVIAQLGQTRLEDFEACWRSMAYSAFMLGQQVLPLMAEAAGGTFICSGATASIRGGAKFSAFASAKFALRGLTQAFAREFQPKGVHVVHTLLDGIIDTPSSRKLHSLEAEKMMKPEDIASIYWSLIQQPRSVWSHEIDLRPQSEAF